MSKVQVVKCLIEDELGRFLLIKRADSDSHAGMWETPGGGIEDKESIEYAGEREIEEETGLIIPKEALSYDQTIKLSDDESGEIMDVHLTSTKSPIAVTNLDLSNNPDHSDYTWICYSDLPTFLSSGCQIDRWTLNQLLIRYAK